MRTATGDYRVDLYNKYGERLHGASLPATSFTEAKQLGEENLSSEVTSFTITRCVYNSLDRED